MYETLSRMGKLVTPELRKLTLEELALMYQKGEYKKDPRVFATAFVKCFRFIKNVGLNKDNQDDGKAFDLNLALIDEADVVSISLEKLDNCLSTFVYGLNKNGNSTKLFLTYFLFIFKNGLITECKKLMTQKRKANIGAMSYDVLVADPTYREPYSLDDKENDEMFLTIPDGLDKLDLRYCNAILNGLLPYSANKSEISRFLDIPTYAVRKMRRRLQNRFGKLFEPDALVF